VERGHDLHPDGAGFLYPAAVMDRFSRFLLSWSLSLTMEVSSAWRRCGGPQHKRTPFRHRQTHQ